MARSNLNWEASKNALKAQEYWRSNGYSFTLVKRYISMDYYNVSKDGVTVKEYPIYHDPKCNIDGMMKDFEQYYNTVKMVMEVQR